jgi:hypothetical protein
MQYSLNEKDDHSTLSLPILGDFSLICEPVHDCAVCGLAMADYWIWCSSAHGGNFADFSRNYADFVYRNANL